MEERSDGMRWNASGVGRMLCHVVDWNVRGNDIREGAYNTMRDKLMRMLAMLDVMASAAVFND